MTHIAKLKAAYNALKDQYTYENKVNFDKVVFDELPKLWGVRPTRASVKRSSLDDVLSKLLPAYKKTVTFTTISADVKSKGLEISDMTLRSRLNKFQNYRVILRRDNPKLFKGLGKLVTACGFWLVEPTTIEKEKVPLLSKFQEFVKVNYEDSESFTTIGDIISDSGMVISTDVAEKYIVNMGHAMYNKSSGTKVVKLRKKKSEEFVNLSEILKEMK